MKYIGNYIKIFVGIFLVCYMQLLLAQNNCSQLLSKANNAYSEGKYEEVIELLDHTIDSCDFDNVELEQARKLLSSSFCKLGEVELAEAEVFSFLKKNPIYQIQTMSDPQPFIETVNRFERTPRLRVGFGLGRYQSFIQEFKTYSVFDVVNAASDYTTQSNISFSLNALYYINQRLSVSIEPTIAQSSFQHTIDYPEIFSIDYNEKASCFRMPVLVGFEVYKKDYHSAIVKTGMYCSSLIQNQSELKYQVPGNGEFNAEGIEDLSRNKYNAGYQFGVGYQYTKSRICFIAEANYGRDIWLYNQSTSRYTNNSILTDYYYVSDDIKMNHFEFKLGISYIISYKIKHKYLSR